MATSYCAKKRRLCSSKNFNHKFKALDEILQSLETKPGQLGPDLNIIK